MRKLLLYFMIPLTGIMLGNCESTSNINDELDTNIATRGTIPRCPKIKNIAPGCKNCGFNGSPTIEVCYPKRYFHGSATSFELFYRSKGEGEDKWKSLGDGKLVGSYEHEAGECDHRYYDVSLQLNNYYEFKAGPKDEATYIYNYYHYERIDSDIIGYEKRYVTFFLSIYVPQTDHNTYEATITMTDNLTINRELQTQIFKTNANQSITSAHIFKSSFYCNSGSSNKTCGTITIDIKDIYHGYHKVYEYTYGYEYSSRYIVGNINIEH